VLLDEPFSALDTALRASTGQAVAEAIRAAGATGVLVTHDRSEALGLCDQVAVLHEGRLAQHDSPRALYTTPNDAYVAAFVGEAAVLAGDAAGTLVHCALGALPTAGQVAAGPAEVLIRPEQIVLGVPEHTAVAHDTAAEGTTATVLRVSYFGHDALVTLRLNSGERLSARTGGDVLPQAGTTVTVTVRGAVQAFTRGRPVPA
jgi:iron(III) transport system ATP-binding protein